MGFEYALVHVKYTIPPAIILAFLYRPLCTRLDLYKIAFLITVAVTATIPWDSYLIRRRIWSYPPHVVVGYTLCDIPAEEVFFFVIQTFNTSILYLILNKPTFHPAYLRSADESQNLQKWRSIGQIVLTLGVVSAAFAVRNDGTGTYLGLVVGWAGPFMLLLWTLAYQFLVGLPWPNVLLPIALPTLYLWIVDTFALQRGTWVIEEGTKLGVYLWPGLEIEEAIFFLVTNCMIVFGLTAFDNALAVLHTMTPADERIAMFPSPATLVRALLKSTSVYDKDRLQGIREAAQRLRNKSRSFYVASGTFEGKLRIDLISLYSFCRVADDLVDDASSPEEAREWIRKLTWFLDTSYSAAAGKLDVRRTVTDNFPPKAQSALLLLPTMYLDKAPLYDLLKGFEMDLEFSNPQMRPATPIKSEQDLELYSARVAGTVAHSCLDLVFHHLTGRLPAVTRSRLIEAGENMGIALQLVNISRDIAVDAGMQRIYIPITWLEEVGLTAAAVIKNPTGERIDELRARLLKKAFEIYGASRAAIEELPDIARGPMRVAVESYMEIGRVLQEGRFPITRGKATVPRWRRVFVAWKALNGGVSRTSIGHL